MRLSDGERAGALWILELHGIQGSDARTSLEQIERATDDVDFASWRKAVGMMRPEALERSYGADAIRAVLALRASDEELEERLSGFRRRYVEGVR